MRQIKIIVEKHPEGYVAYPLGLKGVVVGEGNTYEEALADIKSAIKFHIATFGEEALELEENLKFREEQWFINYINQRTTEALSGRENGKRFFSLEELQNEVS